GLYHALVSTDGCNDPELYLGVVCGYEAPAFASGNKCFPDLSSPVCTYWNVLQVRVRAAKPAGDCNGLMEAGVHPASLRVEQQGQRVNVGTLEFTELAVDEYVFYDLVFVPELLEDVFACGVLTRLGLLGAVQFHEVEQYLT